MIIPFGFSQHTHIFGGPGYTLGAAVTYGCDPDVGGMTIADEAFLARDIMRDEIVIPMMSNLTQYLGVSVKRGPNNTGPFYEAASDEFGTHGTAASPPQVAVLVRKVTAFGGRSQRGRFYLPGVRDASVVDGGLLDGTEAVDWADAVNSWFAEMTTAGLPPVLLHNGSSDPTPILSFDVQSRVATIRRRNRK